MAMTDLGAHALTVADLLRKQAGMRGEAVALGALFLLGVGTRVGDDELHPHAFDFFADPVRFCLADAGRRGASRPIAGLVGSSWTWEPLP